MHFARLFRFAAAAVMLAITTQAGAGPTSYGSYYDDLLVENQNCTTGVCRINFNQLPSDKLLLLSKVNCHVAAQLQITDVLVSISQTPNGPAFGRGLYVNPGPAMYAYSYYHYSFATDARMLIGPSRFPYIEVTTGSGTISATCGIAGDLVTPIQ